MIRTLFTRISQVVLTYATHSWGGLRRHSHGHHLAWLGASSPTSKSKQGDGDPALLSCNAADLVLRFLRCPRGPRPLKYQHLKLRCGLDLPHTKLAANPTTQLGCRTTQQPPGHVPATRRIACRTSTDPHVHANRHHARGEPTTRSPPLLAAAS